MMMGHSFIEKAFGVVPKIGWQIDPFGHSNANARLFAEMGLDAVFFARLDQQEKDKRLEEKTMEWIWRPFWESIGDYA
jgi:alpha-mannosidase